MAPSRGVLFISTAFILSSLFIFALTYGRSRFGIHAAFLTPLQGYQDEPDSGVENLGIALHPEKHALREPQTVNYHWSITKAYRFPDGVEKLVYLINGEFPGPTLEARSGDTLVVEVFNLLEDEGVSFHWHGLHMKGANEMDGTVGITQDAISPGSDFTYKFTIDDAQAGTFWYHSHSDLQRSDGLFGGLIVHEPLETGGSEISTPSYDDEMLLLIGDWYHRGSEDVRASYVTHDSWGREPVPDSLLINGKGAFDCAMAVPSRPLNCTLVSSPVLAPKQKHSRVRIVNTGTLSGITVVLPPSKMTVFQVDGGNRVEDAPPSSAIGILYPGERIDVVVEWLYSHENETNLTIILDAENYSIQNNALTGTQHFPISAAGNPHVSRRGHSYTPLPATSIEGTFDLSTLNGTAIPAVLTAQPCQSILLYTKVEVLAHLGNVPAGFINRTSWAPQAEPLGSLISLPRSSWDKNQLVPLVPMATENEAIWVDIVVNNLDEKGHPFHLHGYDFLILAQYYPKNRGYHAYNPFASAAPKGGPLNLVNPKLKDTVFVPAQGYVVLRIYADNPGIWFFHCHILWHSGTGMAMAIQVGSE